MVIRRRSPRSGEGSENEVLGLPTGGLAFPLMVSVMAHEKGVMSETEGNGTVDLCVQGRF